MNIYMPPQRRETMPERRGTHRHVREYLQGRGLDILSRPGGGRSLPWLKRAGGLVLETNLITEKDAAECLYVAKDLGRQVLVLYDQLKGQPGGGPSDELMAASRRDGNIDANLWLVRYTSRKQLPYMTIDLALNSYVDLGLEMGAPVDRQAELPPAYDRHAFEALR